jgi:hypothetical protein
MFNYVVKDPDSSGLSREFWIKDQDRIRHKDGLTLCPRTCVAQSSSLTLTRNGYCQNLLLPEGPAYRNRTVRAQLHPFATRSAVRDVYRELPNSIELRLSCQIFSFHFASGRFVAEPEETKAIKRQDERLIRMRILKNIKTAYNAAER